MITVLSLSPAVDKVYFVRDFEAGRLYRVGNFVKSPGGKGINVSRVASILGEKVITAGFKAGETGNWLEMQLVKVGAKTAFVEVPGESRTNNNIIDEVNGTETEVLEAGPFIPEQARELFMEEFTQILDKTSVLVCSGGLPEGIEKDFYKILIEKAKTKNIRVILDTSNEVLIHGIKAMPYLIKPNLRELSQYAGRQLKSIKDIVEVSRNIISFGVNSVVTSMGKDGAVFVSENEMMRAFAPELTPVNTIGSGDSMVAGFAAGMSRGYKLPDIFKLGMACAAANTQFKEIGYVTAELVRKYLDEIRVEFIK